MTRDFLPRKAAANRALVDAGHGHWWGAFVDDRLVASLGIFRAGDGLARFQNVKTHPDFRAAAWPAPWSAPPPATRSPSWVRDSW